MQQPTLGSLFAGIGGFDVGFENAGFRSAWQVELNPANRAVLAIPHTRGPQGSSWLTPRQWTQYLQRLNRSSGHAPRMPGPPILNWQTRPAPRSLWAVPLSSLTRTDGIRWLSGSERLKMMGFASNWMRPTLQRLSVPETPLLRRWLSGLGGS
ncbi:DNA cytosine methyltransferase [Pseudomonas brassicacearum]|uniref:DNA cytosine methyltransferase n=1 Tax=Pseudomonas brassicacearum TaxID=930166 RepID=UPI000F466A96